jgi:hypothetical protein
MLVGGVVVYKVMKKVGKLTESRMVHPEPPKFYPLVTDELFEAKVKLKSKKKKVEVIEDELPMDKPADPSLSNTNSPRRATGASVQVGGPDDLTGTDKNEAKGDDWIGDAEEDIEKRGTKGKCTPITKKGCTGKAKTLAKTFKKMAKREKGSKNEAAENPEVLKRRLKAEREKFKKERPLRPTGDDGRGGEPSPHSTQPKVESTTDKVTRQTRARAAAGRPLKKGTAKVVANDSGAEMGDRMGAAEKL